MTIKFKEGFTIKKYLYTFAPILSFLGVAVVTLFGMFQLLVNSTFRKEHGTQFCIRYMLYTAPAVAVPAILIPWLFFDCELYVIILVGAFYLSGVVAAKLLCNWLKKIGS